MQQVSLTEADLADVSAAFGTLIALSGSPNALQPHASATIARLSHVLAAATSAPLRQAHIAAHKFLLWEPCVRELSSICARVKAELGAVAARVAREGVDAVGALSRAADELAAEARGAHDRERRAEEEVAALLQAAQLLEAELQAQQQETRAAKDEVAALKARIASLEAAAAASSSAAASAAANASSSASAPTAAEPGPSQPSAEFLALSASTTALAAVSMEASIALRQRLGLGSFAQPPLQAAQAAQTLQAAQTAQAPHSGPTPTAQPASPTRQSAPSSPSAQSDSQQQQQQRIMPLKVLIADVEAIYASKARADQLAPAARETLEQHLYVWLKARHGAFPGLIASHASAIIRSAHRWAPLDNDAAVFEKILRSEVDEDFRLVQRQLKDTAVELLKQQLRSANANKLEPEIKALVDARTHERSGGVAEESWRPIVRYLYEKSDAEALEQRIEGLLLRAVVAAALESAAGKSRPQQASRSPQQLQRQALVGSARFVAGQDADGASANAVVDEAEVERRINALSRDGAKALLRGQNPTLRIAWPEFVNTLLSFQLEGHEVFLAKFLKMFREYDVEKRGVISTDSFLRMAASSGAGGPEGAARLAQAVDPLGTGKVTFSQSVRVLTSASRR